MTLRPKRTGLRPDTARRYKIPGAAAVVGCASPLATCLNGCKRAGCQGNTPGGPPYYLSGCVIAVLYHYVRHRLVVVALGVGLVLVMISWPWVSERIWGTRVGFRVGSLPYLPLFAGAAV